MSLSELKKAIMHDIYENRMLLTSSRDREEGWTLVSGIWSPFYIQLRILSSFPETLEKVGSAMAMMLKEQAPHVNKLVGVAFAGIPIATSVSLKSGLPACHTRKLVGVRNEEALKRALKEYGQHALLEGIVADGDSLCIVDDLVTGMETKLVARKQILTEVKQRGLSDVQCDDVAVIVNRQQGAASRANELGLRLHCLIPFVDEGIPLLRGLMTPEEHTIITDYLANSSKHQPNA
ncbi:MAG: orotate phosphoribosyltransferase [Candidatus Thorarchaeota archaeon]|jgi:orotate phosphoribosyltransferase